MNCALRTCVYVIISSCFLFSFNNTISAKTGKDHAIIVSNGSSAATPAEFKWEEHNRLSWEDFRGPVNAQSDESAAATHCGIGFRTVNGMDGKPQVMVYNTFYTNRSWVRSDAKIASILDHEQGHFDLCEIYTRILKQRMANFNFNVADVRTALMNIYDNVEREYETRQQAYEQETIHGTNLDIQRQWDVQINKELSVPLAYN